MSLPLGSVPDRSASLGCRFSMPWKSFLGHRSCKAWGALFAATSPILIHMPIRFGYSGKWHPNRNSLSCVGGHLGLSFGWCSTDQRVVEQNVACCLWLTPPPPRGPGPSTEGPGRSKGRGGYRFGGDYDINLGGHTKILNSSSTILDKEPIVVSKRSPNILDKSSNTLTNAPITSY